MKPGKRASLVLICGGAVAVSSACSSSKPSTQEPQTYGVTKIGGHGFPYGTSSGEPWQVLSKTAQSREYGYSKSMPVKVGGGPAGERRYLNSLQGPEGQEIQYERLGSCCSFETKNSEIGGLLDVFSVTWQGAPKAVELYLDMYDLEEPMVPLGLKARK